MADFGKVVRRARLESGLSLTELAVRCRISVSHLSRIERGEDLRMPSEDVILRLAGALQREPDSMFRAVGKLPRDLREFVLANPEVMRRLREELARERAARREEPS